MKQTYVRQNVVSLICGFIFAIGLALSGMTQPQKVIGFLNPWDWDPALLFVMVGAIGVHALFYPLTSRRRSPLLDTKWHIPTRNDLTTRLVLGAALFGIGWGLGGYCPGPGVTSLAAGDLRAVAFVAAMIVGMLLFKKTEPLLKLKE